jgi:hypothetical protein
MQSVDVIFRHRDGVLKRQRTALRSLESNE